MKGKDLVLVAGGTGIAPLASLVEFLIKKRRNFKKIYLLYGAKNSKELLFKERFPRWKKFIELLLCVEEKDRQWEGNTGMVIDVCYKIDTEPQNTLVIMCGPPIMYKFVAQELVKLTPKGSPSGKIKPEQIYVSMETRMKCGIGKCQHCTIGKKYCCLDGPVFRYDEITNEL